MTELMALTVACDRTRLVTYMLGNARSERSFDFLGLDMPHHRLSHYENVDEAAGYDAVVSWAVDRWVSLVSRLQALPGADGSLLDDVVTVCLSGMGDGGLHSPDDLPVLLAGDPEVLTGGVHQVADGRPLGDLWLTLLRSWGLDDATFGDSGTEPLDLRG